MQRLSNNVSNVTLLTKSLDDSEEWKVIKKYQKDNGTVVKINRFVSIPGTDAEETHPSCKDCEYFQSSWEPCECMGAVFSRKEEEFKNIKNLHPYWHLEHHPLWSSAHVKLGLTIPICKSNYMQIINESQIAGESKTSNIPENTDFNATLIDTEIFTRIKFPTQEHIRVAKLREKGDEVINIAKQNPASYKHFMSRLVMEENALNRICLINLKNSISLPPLAEQSEIILPPLAKK